MEARPGGGGAGGCIALIFILLIPLVGLGWAFWPAKVKAKSAPMEYATETVPQGAYSLFPGRPDWGQLELTIRGIKPAPMPVCSDPVTLPWNGGQVQSCGPVADPVI